MVTGAQIRAARGLLNMSVAELAERTGLAVNTIRKAEGTNEVPPITAAPMQLIMKTFADAGVIFLEAGEHGVGVRFARPESSGFQSRRREK
jgi:transcriptional regulator with XRE-family HTH domain